MTGVSPGREVNGHVAGHDAPFPGAARSGPASFRVRPNPWTASVVATAGVALHMYALAQIERLVSTFPSVPDVLLERLPYVNFGLPGELYFAAFLALTSARMFVGLLN